MKLGIVGLPNVGKTTLFNALTHAQAAATAYAFTSAESNLGVVAVPDPRLDRLDEVLETPKKVNATIDLVDIAGLAEGASRGEGLGKCQPTESPGANYCAGHRPLPFRCRVPV